MTQNQEILKTDVLEQFLRVRYAISMNFIDVLKKTWMLQAKNAKLQYANEIKCKFSKIAKIVQKHQKLNQHSADDQKKKEEGNSQFF